MTPYTANGLICIAIVLMCRDARRHRQKSWLYGFCVITSVLCVGLTVQKMILVASYCWSLFVESMSVFIITPMAQKIAHSTEEKDLGVVINQSLSPSHHIGTCVSRANRLVGLIKRTYENKSKRNIIALYKSLVRPHLEYCVQAWRPHNQKDIDNLEGVHRRMTKMINGMGEDEYNLRLSKTKLLSLEMRRLRSDLKGHCTEFGVV